MKSYNFGEIINFYMKNQDGSVEVDEAALEAMKDWTMHYERDGNTYYVFFEEPIGKKVVNQEDDKSE